jgi:(p)ppGpp synthase/HD superfamily hydrolase
LDPIAYEEIENQLNQREDRQITLQNIKSRISERVRAEHPNAVIEGRVKSVYGIYRKVYVQGRSFDEIFDIYAIRIIVDSVIECYNILGIIHDMFRPIPNRFKDYISTPKQNMYQSLHTSVFDKEGVPFEHKFVHGKCSTPPNTELLPIGNTKLEYRAKINLKSAFFGSDNCWKANRKDKTQRNLFDP